MNPTFEDVFGFETSEIVERTVDDALVPDDRSWLHEYFTRRSQQGERIEASVQRRTTDGPEEFLLRIIPFGTENEISDGAYALYINVNEHQW